MDMELTAPVHYDAFDAIHVIDDEWLAAVLPVEDVEVPADAVAPNDDDDGVPQDEDNEADKWTDTAAPVAEGADPESQWTGLEDSIVEDTPNRE